MKHLRGWVMRYVKEGLLPTPFYAKEDGLYGGSEHTILCYTWKYALREGWIFKPIEIKELPEPQYIPKGEPCLVWAKGASGKWLWFSLDIGKYTSCTRFMEEGTEGQHWDHVWTARIPPITYGQLEMGNHPRRKRLSAVVRGRQSGAGQTS